MHAVVTPQFGRLLVACFVRNVFPRNSWNTARLLCDNRAYCPFPVVTDCFSTKFPTCADSSPRVMHPVFATLLNHAPLSAFWFNVYVCKFMTFNFLARSIFYILLYMLFSIPYAYTMLCMRPFVFWRLCCQKYTEWLNSTLFASTELRQTWLHYGKQSYTVFEPRGYDRMAV